MAQQTFKKGDRIDIGTGYQCDKGTFIRYEGNNVVWESDMGGEFKTPLSEYNINKLNKSTMEPKKIYTEEQVRDMLSGAIRSHWIDEFLSRYTPISIPSDEEIDKEAFQVPYDGTNEFYDNSFIKGAKWMRDKILNK